MSDKIILTFSNPEALARTYTPFIRDGGIFVKTRDLLALGTTVQLELSLQWLEELIEYTGKVVLVTPLHAINHAQSGYVVQPTGKQAEFIKKRLIALVDSDAEIGADILV